MKTFSKIHVVNFQTLWTYLVQISGQSDYFSMKINFCLKLKIIFFWKFTTFCPLNIFLIFMSVKQIVYNANLFIWQHSRDLEKFWGIWRTFEGFAEVFRDLERFWGIWRRFQGFGEFFRNIDRFWWIWRLFGGFGGSFEGFREVLRDFEKFQGISKSFEGFGEGSRNIW